MEQIGLKAVLEDADFQKGIKKYQDSLDKATGVTSTFATTATKTSKGGITDLWSAFQLVERIGGQVVDVISDIVNETVDYNKTVREMTQVTGLGAEEVSRIIQVSDDWGISINEVRTSLAFMNKQGVTPSIDNLAKLADEYVNTEDKSVFAEKAVKILGRGYQTLIPILAQGGDALRDQAAAIDENMLATEDSIAASREYEVALDTLQDTVTGLKYELGRGLLPILVEVVKTLNDLVVAQNNDIDVRRLSQKLVEEGIITEKERLDLLWKILTGEKDQADAIDELNASLKPYNEALAGATAGLVQYSDYTATANIKTDEATIAFDHLYSSISNVDLVMQSYTNKLLFNIAAANLDEDAQLRLAEKLGLVDKGTAEAYAGIFILNTIYDLNKDGTIDATEATNEYYNAVKKLDDQILGMKDKTVSIDIIYSSTGEKPGEHGYRAAGGPVHRGSPYIVGEAGAELFVPNASGAIIPNNMTEAMIAAFRLFSPPTAAMPIGGGGGSIVTINMGGVVIANDMDEQAFMSRVEGVLSRELGV